MRLGLTDVDAAGGGDSDIRNVLIRETELEPTQTTCTAPVDLNPTQVLAQMGITELAQVATKSGYMYAINDLIRIFGNKFGTAQKDAYGQICKNLCKGGEEDGPKTRKANPRISYWNGSRHNRELHERFKKLLQAKNESGTIRECWERWNKQQTPSTRRYYCHLT
eukprot:5927636-Pyramimonas_sp.AAC.1